MTLGQTLDGVDVYCCDVPQYSRLFGSRGWRVAIINHGPKFAEENLNRVERHLNSDEAFILLEGTATLVAGEGADRIKMERGKVYNVLTGAWHHIVTVPGAKVLVVEGDDTGADNTEYRELS